VDGILELQRLATGEPDRDPGRDPEPPCGGKTGVKLIKRYCRFGAIN